MNTNFCSIYMKQTMQMFSDSNYLMKTPREGRNDGEHLSQLAVRGLVETQHEL